MEYRLSICMMVKNEENNLPRCLNSLKGILENPLVELIIVDTGSSDNTINIAKQYTTKLYFHEWNNNFSEMRNISISYAAGEWIFLIDADECLESIDEAYKLLMDIDIKQYNTIQMKIKSYTNMQDENSYSVLTQPRVFRNDGTFKYEGTVHNQPIFKFPVADTDIFIGHYGYVTSDKELMEKKFQRTATLLKSELEKDPENIYYQYQLSVSYSMYGEYKTALNEMRKTYSIIQKRPRKERETYVYMYGMYVRTSFINKELDETIKICKEGIKIQPDYLDLYYIIANVLIRKGERFEAIGYFKKYIELFNDYENLSISKDPSYIIYNKDSESSSVAYSNMASYYYDNVEYEKAYKYLNGIDDKKYKANLMCKVLLKLDLHDELDEYYNELDDEDVINEFTQTLENEAKEFDEEKGNRIFNIFRSKDDKYGLYNKIRLEKENKDLLIKEFLTEYDFNDLSIFYGSIFNELKDNRRLMISSFKKINNNILKQYVGYLVTEFKEMKEYFYDYLMSESDKIRKEDLQSNRVFTIIASIILIKGMEDAKNTKRDLEYKYVEIFNIYLEKGFNKLEYIYDMKKIRMIYNTLDATEDKFFMIMYLVNESIKNSDFELAIKYIKEALKQFPYMAIALQEYQKEVFKEIKI